MIIEGITQPTNISTLIAIESVFKREQVLQADIAAAYLTLGGVQDLIAAMSAAAGPAWGKIQKRWLTSVDYYRTEPLALRTIGKLPKSQVRIHDAENLLANNCAPRKPFHPKVFIFRASTVDCVLAGSGNVSRSGLSRGHEAGILIRANRPEPVPPSGAGKTVRSFRSWYRTLWQDATPVSEQLFDRYERLYESLPNLASPTWTEDDIAPPPASRSSLTAEDLRKLRACRHFWIEARNITRNRGQHLPGNQLMMTPLSRVFFGVPAAAVPHNSPLKSILISFNGNDEKQCSLTFSDNGMDKLTLPIPGAGGPPAYDGQNLLFRRVRAGRFELALGTQSERASWLKRSKAIHAAFKMSSGRIWGVF